MLLYGENGSGKTNLLEAISLFSPGKGFRKANFVDFQNYAVDTNNQDAPCILPWGLHASIAGYALGTGVKTSSSRQRQWFLNDAPLKSQGELYDIVRVFWLTPEHDRIFLNSPSIRRNFIDRMAVVLDADHQCQLKILEDSLKQRLKLLVDGKMDDVWLSQLEKNLVEASLKVQIVRKKVIALFDDNQVIKASMQGKAEAITSFQEMADIFRQNRTRDAAAGMTTFGVQRSDLFVEYLKKNMPAEKCSTGEQKLLLLELMFGFLNHILQHINTATFILLLDDTISHLDFANRVVLFDKLKQLSQKYINFQVWFSATNDTDFVSLAPNLQKFLVVSGTVEEK